MPLNCDCKGWIGCDVMDLDIEGIIGWKEIELVELCISESKAKGDRKVFRCIPHSQFSKVYGMPN